MNAVDAGVHTVMNQGMMENRSLVIRHPDDPVEVFPDFFVVGPQRTGTTWLHDNLVRHPQVFMPAKKELYFFNLLDMKGHPKHRSCELSWYLSHFKPGVTERIRRGLKSRILRRNGSAVTVRGEATASYAAMKGHLIDEIVRIRPDVKAVVMVRNPITRAWSHAVKDLVKRPRRGLKEVTNEEWSTFFRDPYQLACGRCSELIDNWVTRLGEEQVFIGRFEDIRESPYTLLGDLYRFLGIEVNERLMSHAHVITNPSGGGENIPGEIRSVLREIFNAELKELNARFGWSYR